MRAVYSHAMVDRGEMKLTYHDQFAAALTLCDAKQYGAAHKLLKPLYRQNPEDMHLAGSLGMVYMELGQYEKAHAIWGHLLTLDPKNPLTWLNLGTTYQRQFDFDKSDWCFEQAMQFKPNFLPMLVYGIGMNKVLQGKYAEALKCYESVVGDPAAVNSQGMMNLKLGNFVKGAVQIEERLKYATNVWPTAAIPQWDGQPIPVYSPVLLVLDQGVGDLIFYSRLARTFVHRHPQTSLYVGSPELADLIRYLYPSLYIEVMSVLDGTYNWPVQMALGSLPAYYAVEHNILPGDFTNRSNGLTGTETWLTFRGSRNNPIDLCRSMNIQDAVHLCRLFKRYDTKIHVAQADLTASECASFYSFDSPMTFSGSWVETAELLRTRCGLLITVDTAMAHLATALGIPCIVLLSFAADWRWEIPGMWSNCKLVYQKTPGRWDDVFEEVVEAAREMQREKVIA